jgi:hypothetical protein
MARLREQLQAAKKSHLAARYPGDLAADVLAPQMSITRQLFIGAAVAAGIAAIILMIIWLGRQTPAPQQIAEEPQPQAAEQVVSLPFTIERPTDSETEIQLAPPAAGSFAPSFSSSSIPAIWGFPTPASIQEELSQTQSQEEAL